MRSLLISLTSPATLERLKFEIGFQLRNFSGYDAFHHDLPDADVWSHLDSIITHPIGSRLQRVEIDIKYCFRYGDGLEPNGTEIVESVLDALPLLRDKGILFVAATKG